MPDLHISTIIPVYNCERYLGNAIQSVLDQTIVPSEIIVVNDGSINNSATVARAFKQNVYCIHQSNQGAAVARNIGVRHATGDLLTFLDADDLWTPDKLYRQVTFLQEASQEAIIGRVENFISPELNDHQKQILAKSAAQGANIHIGSLLIRRNAFMRVGWFDTRWRHGEFIEWWARAMNLNLAYKILPDMVMRRRLHADNLMRREKDGRMDYLGILREMLVQRRAISSPAGQPEGLNPDG